MGVVKIVGFSLLKFDAMGARSINQVAASVAGLAEFIAAKQAACRQKKPVCPCLLCPTNNGCTLPGIYCANGQDWQ